MKILHNGMACNYVNRRLFTQWRHLNSQQEVFFWNKPLGFNSAVKGAACISQLQILCNSKRNQLDALFFSFSSPKFSFGSKTKGLLSEATPSQMLHSQSKVC